MLLRFFNVGKALGEGIIFSCGTCAVFHILCLIPFVVIGILCSVIRVSFRSSLILTKMSIWLFRNEIVMHCLTIVSVSSSSWCLGRIAVCDTPCTFLLRFFFFFFFLLEYGTVNTQLNNQVIICIASLYYLPL